MSKGAEHCARARSLSDPLGKYTDNSANLIQQGFQRIKDRFKLLHSARKILKGERTASCFYSRIDKTDGVGVLLNKHRNKANYSNIMRCANAWGCPVCSAIISEHRKTEVKQAMDWWQGQGGSVLLLTLTVPHYSHTDIKQLKVDLKKHIQNSSRVYVHLRIYFLNGK